MSPQVTSGLPAPLLFRPRHVSAAAWFPLPACWAAAGVAVWMVGAVSAPAIVAHLVLVVIAGLLFGWHASVADSVCIDADEAAPAFMHVAHADLIDSRVVRVLPRHLISWLLPAPLGARVEHNHAPLAFREMCA